MVGTAAKKVEHAADRDSVLTHWIKSAMRACGG